MQRETEGYLKGYRVLDLTDFRGMMAGRIMADLGAEVVVIEPPEGAPARRLGSTDGCDSILWSVFSHNKKSVSCNVATAEGRRLRDGLAVAADFVLVSGSPTELKALDLDYARLAELNPGLIYVTITPFGLSGEKSHYADSDLIIWAASGTLSRNRVRGRVPVRIGAAYQGYYHGAAEAVVGALLALAERAASGKGQHVDVSFQNSMVFSNQLQGLYSLVGDVAAPHSQSVSIFPAIWKTRDGYLQFSLTSGKATGHFSNGFMAWLAEEGALPADFPSIDWRVLPQTSGSGLSSSGVTKEKYAEMGVGDEIRAKLETIMEHFFLERDTDELLVAARDRRLLLAPILSVEHIARNEQFRARNVWFGASQSDDPQPALMGAFASVTPPAFVDRGGPGAPGSANSEIFGRWLGRETEAKSIGSAENC